MTTANQKEYHSYLEVEIKMKKAIGPRKSLFVCMLQLQEAIESGGEGGCRGGCVTVYRLCVREELVVCS